MASERGVSMTGEELKQRRKGLGLTQAQLAALLGSDLRVMSINTVSRWETGSVPIPHPGMLSLALEALERRRDGREVTGESPYDVAEIERVLDAGAHRRHAVADTPESVDRKMGEAMGRVSRLAASLTGKGTG
jgi:transcriptional regulator with XRE-family HTH domain